MINLSTGISICRISKKFLNWPQLLFKIMDTVFIDLSSHLHLQFAYPNCKLVQDMINPVKVRSREWAYISEPQHDMSI